jgi:hypothetical protein
MRHMAKVDIADQLVVSAKAASDGTEQALRPLQQERSRLVLVHLLVQLARPGGGLTSASRTLGIDNGVCDHAVDLGFYCALVRVVCQLRSASIGQRRNSGAVSADAQPS